MSANDNPPRERETLRESACPICGKPRDPRYDPFCSKRCADVDLHRWLKGNYLIPGAERGDETDGEEMEEE
ncbi:MAG TPA: DNA gyrase inhibitor YacG [Roseiarcus sp.]|nr:DNA gyrase inhibitor YacG [Roseiarcus sp.]